ncbi:MAG: hypothetical protein L6R35_007511 [Caloplaca aegaea]|nr:MAG: hypothetical protein L6R35_007511 [Caloplaca aegaea]
MAKEVKIVDNESDDDGPLLLLVGSRIRTLRRRAKLKQSEVAKLIGTGQSYIVGVEAGEQNITLKTLGRIAAALGVPPAFFLLEGEMALAADEGGFDKFSALLRTAMQESGRVSDLLRQMYALTSTQTTNTVPFDPTPPLPD